MKKKYGKSHLSAKEVALVHDSFAATTNFHKPSSTSIDQFFSPPHPLLFQFPFPFPFPISQLPFDDWLTLSFQS